MRLPPRPARVWVAQSTLPRVPRSMCRCHVRRAVGHAEQGEIEARVAANLQYAAGPCSPGRLGPRVHVCLLLCGWQDDQLAHESRVRAGAVEQSTSTPQDTRTQDKVRGRSVHPPGSLEGACAAAAAARSAPGRRLGGRCCCIHAIRQHASARPLTSASCLRAGLARTAARVSIRRAQGSPAARPSGVENESTGSGRRCAASAHSKSGLALRRPCRCSTLNSHPGIFSFAAPRAGRRALPACRVLTAILVVSADGSLA